MNNLESTSDKLKIERLSDLVKSLYENIDDLKSRLDEKNITQADKAFAELFEKHRELEKDFNIVDANLNKSYIELDIAEETIRDKNKKIYELQDSSLQQGYKFNKLMQEYNEKITTVMNERDYYKERVIASETKLSQAEETIASYKKTYETLRKENEEANHLSLTMRTMYENLYDNYRDVKVELADYAYYSQGILDSNLQLRKTISKIEKEKTILENNAAKHEKEIENLTATISGMENELNKKDFENNELNCAVHLASYILGNHNDYPRD